MTSAGGTLNPEGARGPLSVGQVGLGAIGRIFAGHFLDSLGALWVHDADPQRLREMAARGAATATSPRELASHCEAIVLSLPDPASVEHVMCGPGGILEEANPGTVVVDLSTVGPGTSRRIHGLAEQQRVDYLDAPLSGGAPGGAGTDGARDRTVTFMVGGDEAAFERAKPLLGMVGQRFFYMGPSGSGSAVKLVSNLVAGLHNLVASEAFVLAAALGVRPERLLEVFDGTDAKSYWLAEYFAPRILRGDFDPGFSVDLQYKDHHLAAELGHQLGVPLLLNDLALQIYQMMRATGRGQRDLVDAVRFLADMSGVQLTAGERVEESSRAGDES